MLGVLGVTPLAYNFATDIATWIFLKFFFSCSNLFVHSWNSHIFLSLLTDAYATIERRITEQTKRGRHKWCIHKVHIFWEGNKYLTKSPTLKFGLSEKHTKFEKKSSSWLGRLLSKCTKYEKDCANFVCFSESLNFTNLFVNTEILLKWGEIVFEGARDIFFFSSTYRC